MKTVIPIAEIKARESDPAVSQGAQSRMDKFNERARPYIARIEALGAQAIRAKNPAARVNALREMLDPVAAAASGVAACGKGCSACCHIAVTLTAEEAEVIGKEIGIKPTMPAQYIEQGGRDATAAKYYGTACPFLVADKCSIYASRPLSCRTLYNMDSDALLCTVVPGDAPKVPYLNHWQFTNVIVRAFIASGSAPRFADLRDFFPKGKGKP
jgi:Fe-S-cluster containining protein